MTVQVGTRSPVRVVARERRLGTIVRNAGVVITNVGTGGAATVYSDEDLTTTIASLRTDSNGVFEFYAPPGLYSVAFTGSDAFEAVENVHVVGDDTLPSGTSVPVARTRTARYLMENATSANPLIISHQGNNNHGPTDCRFGYEAAYSQGITMIDGDVTITDEGPVTASGIWGGLLLNHDTTIDRMTSGTGTVSQLSMEYCKAQRIIGSRFGPGYPDDIPVWSAADAIGWAAAAQVALTLEAKTGLDRLLNWIVALNRQDWVIPQSDNEADIAAMKAAGCIACIWMGATDATAAMNAGKFPLWKAQGLDVLLLHATGTVSSPGTDDSVFIAASDAGLRLWADQINLRADRDHYLGLRNSAGGDVITGILSDEPIYIRSNGRRTTKAAFAGGVWGHGYVSGTGDDSANERPAFLDTAHLQFTGTNYRLFIGELSPNPANATIKVDGIVWTTAPAVTTVAFAVGFNLTYDSPIWHPSALPPNQDGYTAALQFDGTLVLYKDTQGGARNPLGSVATTPLVANGTPFSLTIQTTATQVTVTRSDTSESLTVTDSSRRGLYGPAVGINSATTGVLEISNVTLP